ncbi:MAG: hypothetical protein KC457_02775, partial [Myxococcales bacterium]|nr:hypothetical protein [Myxococcales bacterium]
MERVAKFAGLAFVLLACSPEGRADGIAVTLGADELDSVGDGTTVEDDGSSGSETTTETTGTTGAMPLPCDPGFVFTPDPPGTGALLNVAFTDPSPLAYVDLQATGPGSAAISWAGITTNDPWTWNWTVTSLSPGVWTFSFGAGDPWMVTATCQVEVLDTGTPPDPPMGACDGKVCGEPDGLGGVCTDCPMVGECLDPPSPYNPDGEGPWSCLDNASCNGEGSCRIWCPGEPCNMAAHPDGCPQGVETCWVDATITSYEEACKACCESRYHQPTGEYACWDEAFNLCRYPTDCGLP